MMKIGIGLACAGAVAGALLGCGNGDTGATGSGGAASSAASTGHGSTTATSGTGGGGTGTAQTPPEGAAAVEAWLTKGDYKKWKCEAAVHAARSPSPHGFNRICSNDLISANATATGPWPKGAAAVKELYKTAADTAPVGYAVYLKTAADSGAGANWYWYERVPLDSMAPHDTKGVVADGPGSSGPAQNICVGCHAGAGMDAMHTPSPNGHDFVYTPVP